MKKILLSLLVLIPLLNYGQFSESFEGGTTIPTGWTVINGGSTNTWVVVDLSASELTAQEGTNVASIQYNTPAAHNDFLVTPAVTVTDGVSDFLSFWARSRDPDYPETISVKISTTTATAAAFTTTLIAEVAPDSGPDFFNYTFDLSPYEGQTVYIGFHSTTHDMFAFDLDEVVVSDMPTCGLPTAFTFVAPDPTPTSVNIGWTAPTLGPPTGYQFEYGPAGFVQGTGTTLNPTTNVANLTTLTPGTDYAFYIRTDCGGGDYSNWVGPITFTTLYEPASLPYAFGFEVANGGGWSSAVVGTTGSAWTIEPTSADIPSYEGDNVAVAGANGGVSNAWLFSRGINLTANSTVTVTYYMRKVALAGVGNINNLQVTYGTDATAEAQTNVLATYTDYTTESYTQKTNTFTAPTTGVYYIGFNYTAPAHVQADFGVIALDNVGVTAVLGTNELLASQLSVYPNPTANVINISNGSDILVNGVQIVDLNGRTVKSLQFEDVTEAQINISDLANGMYMMTVSSDKGTMVKKIVKN